MEFQIRHPSAAVRFDPEAFLEAQQAHGIRFKHWRAMRCPVGLIDKFDQRKPHDDHEGCSNGFIFTEAGTITCIFTSNNNTERDLDAGLVDGSAATLSIPRHYDGTDIPVSIAHFDRLYHTDVDMVVPNWQSFEHHITGIDKLNFPVCRVWELVDSSGRRYQPDVDFVIKHGNIVWVGDRPGIDPGTRKGAICSVRYDYIPYYFVKNVMHEIRVIRQTGSEESPYVAERAPQTIYVAREYIFEKESNDMQAKNIDSPRQISGPVSGSFGPR